MDRTYLEEAISPLARLRSASIHRRRHRGCGVSSRFL
jgi:hypothetical protein